MLQPEFQSGSHEIDNQRPFKIAVTISANVNDSGSNRAKLVKNAFRANIAKMPDFICILGHLFHALRQTIVRVRKNKNAQCFRFFFHCLLAEI